MGILKHGFGCWGLIVREEGMLGLMAPLQLELDLRIPAAAMAELNVVDNILGLGQALTSWS